MQANPSTEGTLPQQESKRIIQDLFHEPASIDDFQDAEESTPASVANNSEIPAIVNHSQNTAERESSDTLRDEKKGITIPGEKNGAYQGSSDTIGDEDRQDLKAQEGAPLGGNSYSTGGDDEKEGRSSQQNTAIDRASCDSSRDLEKGDTGPKEHNEVDQDGEDERKPQWENNVVGWDGPNDPQNPHNWKKSKKYTVTVFYSSMTFCITFASSIFSTATMVTAKMYGVSNEVMTLGTSLFVFVSPAHSQHHQPNTDKWNRGLPSAQ